MKDVANQIARQLYAMAARKRTANLSQSLANEHYQRTFTDEYETRFSWFPKIAHVPTPIGSLANVHVSQTAPQYAAMVARSEEMFVDPREYEWRDGELWVASYWLE